MRSELRGKTAEARGLRNRRSMLPEGPGRRARFHGGLNGFVGQLLRSAFIGVHLRFLFCRGLRGLRALVCPVCSIQTGRAEAPPHPVRDQRTPSPSVPEAISRRTVLKRRPLAKPISGSKTLRLYVPDSESFRLLQCVRGPFGSIPDFHIPPHRARCPWFALRS